MKGYSIIVYAFILTLYFGQLCCKAGQSSVLPEVQDSEGYQLVWSDEFTNPGKPDPAKWTYELGFVRNRELQWYQPENAFCENGMLVIEARQDTIQNPNYEPSHTSWRKNRKNALYSSASITTRGLHAWTYGKFEIKARIKTQNGLWPAIWTIGQDRPWPFGGEIDIMEYYGGNILANAAWAGKNQNQVIWDDMRLPVSSFNDPDWDTKFHIWEMVWTKNSIKIYMDDQLLNTIELEKTINRRGQPINPFMAPHFLILNLAIGGNAGGDPSDTPFPSRYEIDYVRIYQK